MSFPTIPAVIAALLSAGSAGAVAQSYRAPTEDGAGPDARVQTEAGAEAEAGKRRGGRGLLAHLDVRPDQAEKIKAINAEARKAHAADRDAMKKLRADLAAELRKDSPNAATVRSIYQRMDAMKASHRAERREALMEIHAVLDSAQRNELADRVAEGHRGKGKGMRGKGKRKGKRDAKGKNADTRDAKGKTNDKGKRDVTGKRERDAKGKRDVAAKAGGRERARGGLRGAG